MAITKVHPVMIEVSNNVTSNTFGSSNLIPQFTFDASGVIVAGSNVAMQINTFDIANGSITNEKLAANSVNVLTNIISTGVANANTYLNGAGEWSVVSVGAGAFGANAAVFTSSGTFTIPSSITNIKVTVVGGGGGSTPDTYGGTSVNGAGGGGTAIKYLTNLIGGSTLSVTVGSGGTISGNGGTTSVDSGTQPITPISATGGTRSSPRTFADAIGAIGIGGIGSGGDINLQGQPGTWSSATGSGGASSMGFGGDGNRGLTPGLALPGRAGRIYGGGAGGGYGVACQSPVTGNTGGQGIVIFEW